MIGLEDHFGLFESGCFTQDLQYLKLVCLLKNDFFSHYGTSYILYLDGALIIEVSVFKVRNSHFFTSAFIIKLTIWQECSRIKCL